MPFAPCSHIHHLPFEHLAIIFDIVASEPCIQWPVRPPLAGSNRSSAKGRSTIRTMWRFHILRDLKLVCHRWADVMNDFPALWAEIDQEAEIPYALARSKYAHVSTHRLLGLNLSPRHRFSSENLIASSERWKHIELRMPWELFPVLSQLEHQNAPWLEHFDITVRHPTTLQDVEAYCFSEPINFFGGNLPRLVFLRLAGVKALRGHPYFSALRVLKIAEPMLSVEDIINIVKDNTKLTILDVNGVIDTPVWTPHTTVRNDTLQEINLPGRAGLHILPWIVTPQCKSTRTMFHLGDEGQLPLGAAAALEHFARHASLSQLDLKISWDVEGSPFVANGAPVTCCGKLEAPRSYELKIFLTSNWEKGAEWIDIALRCFRDLSPAAATEIVFDWSQEGENRLHPRLLSSLMRLPATTLVFHHKVPLEFLEPFGRPIDDFSGEPKWAFPGLEAIRLCRSSTEEGVSTMAKGLAIRYGRVVDEGPKTPLKEVCLPEWTGLSSVFTDVNFPVTLLPRQPGSGSCPCRDDVESLVAYD